jgi:hypothetical protein
MEIDTRRGKLNVVCPGYVVTYRGNMTGASDLAVYIDEDTLFGESMGVYMAVQWACCNQSSNLPPVYNIFTDNKAVVCNIYRYLEDWLSRSDEERHSIAAQPFMLPNAWRAICYNIALIIFKNFCPIRVFYTPGHVNMRDKNHLSKKANTMMEINSSYHSQVDADEFHKVILDASTFNTMIDVYTRNWINGNRDNIINDINDPHVSLILGPDKPFSIKWQLGFSMVCKPMYMSPHAYDMLLIKPTNVAIQRPKLA